MSQWYYGRDEQQYGPVTAEQLKGLARSGELRPADLVWRDGMAEWTPARKIPNLFAPVTQAAASGASVAGHPVPAIAQPVHSRSGHSQAADPRTAHTVAQPQVTHPQVAVEPSAYGHVVPGPGASDGDLQQAYAPNATLPYEAPSQGVILTSPRCLELLRATRPWARFISVMFCVGGVLYVVMGILALALATTNPSRRDAEVTPQILVGLVGALIYFGLGYYLGKYASRITDLLTTRRTIDLEAALDAQAGFWRLAGIIMLVAMCLVVAVVFVLLIAGGMR